MATVPPITTWAPSITTETTAANFNARLRDTINFLKATPLCVLRKNSNQTISNDSWTGLTWQTEDIDSDNGHSTVTDTNRYTAQTAGYYLFASTVEFVGNGSGFRQVRFSVSSGAVVGEHSIIMNGTGANTADINTCAYAFMNIGDWVQVEAYQNSGGSLDVQNDGGDTRFEIKWVSL
jgi:hypothetical protein